MNSMHWTEAVSHCHHQGEAYVLATVMGVAGSTPREPGSKMVITAHASYSTIGGGQLEFAVMLQAREYLLSGQQQQQITAFPLAASGQCCGGNVSVLFEVVPACGQQIWVYGAGHVARQLITVLGGLDCQVQWMDVRDNVFPASVPANVTCTTFADVDSLVASLHRAPDNANVLILTHDHAQDFQLTFAALSRNLWVGLIGSATKAARFRQRLHKQGLDNTQLDNLQCPVGKADIPGKLPMEVAISISAELLCRHHRAADKNVRSARRGLDWKALKQAMMLGEVSMDNAPDDVHCVSDNGCHHQ